MNYKQIQNVSMADTKKRNQNVKKSGIINMKSRYPNRKKKK